MAAVAGGTEAAAAAAAAAAALACRALRAAAAAAAAWVRTQKPGCPAGLVQCSLRMQRPWFCAISRLAAGRTLPAAGMGAGWPKRDPARFSLADSTSSVLYSTRKEPSCGRGGGAGAQC